MSSVNKFSLRYIQSNDLWVKKSSILFYQSTQPSLVAPPVLPKEWEETSGFICRSNGAYLLFWKLCFYLFKESERSNSFKCINSTKMHHHRLSGILTYYLRLYFMKFLRQEHLHTLQLTGAVCCSVFPKSFFSCMSVVSTVPWSDFQN